MRWIWALPVLALIWWMAFVGERPKIEADLAKRSNAALATAGLGWARTSFEGIEGRVAGRAFADGQRMRAKDVVRDTWGVWAVHDATSLIAKRDVYVWSARVEGGNVQLAGYYPDPGVHEKVLGAVGAAFPSLKVVDRMEPALGGPPNAVWIAGVKFGIDQLQRLKNGEIELKGRDLAVAGEARDALSYRRVKGDLARRLPNDIVLARDNVRPPVVDPYTWSVSRESNQLVLGGYVPSEKGREELMTRAKAAFPKLAIIDKMATAGGASTAWDDLTAKLFTILAKLNVAQATLKGNALDVTGTAETQAEAEAAAVALDNLGEPFQVTHNIRFIKTTIPTVTPYVTSILRDDKSVTLSGYAPNQAEIDRLIAAAKAQAGKVEVISALAIANGAPEGWRLCVMAGLEGVAKLDSGRAEVVARKLQVTGVTRDEETGLSLPGIVRAAANRACEDVVEVKLDLPPEPDLKWQATWRAGKLALTGEVPNSTVKAALAEQARRIFPKAEITDESRVKPGRSQKWPKVAALLLEMLARLRQGEAGINGTQVSLVGQAPDTAVSTAVLNRFKRGLVTGYTGEPKLEIKSDAMIWAEQEAKRKAEAQRQAERVRQEQLKETAEKAAEDARKKAEADQQRMIEERKRREAEEARKQAEVARRAAEEERQRAQQAEAERKRQQQEAQAAAEARKKAEAERRRLLEEEKKQQAAAEAWKAAEAARRAAEAERARRAELEAERRRQAAAEAAARQARLAEEARRKAAEEARRKAAEEASRKAAEEAARKAAEDAKRKAEEEARRREAARKALSPEQRKRRIEVARRCQDGMSRAISRNRIRFRFDSDELRAVSRKTLDRVIKLIKSCDGMRIEVDGHTDSMGSAETNMKLSERRVQAVIRYLVAGGVEPDRLIARGFGETRPAAPNNSPLNRALNRRIEFKVIAD